MSIEQYNKIYTTYNKIVKDFNYVECFKNNLNLIIKYFIENYNIRSVFNIFYYSFICDFNKFLFKDNKYKFIDFNNIPNSELNSYIINFINFYCDAYKRQITKIMINSIIDNEHIFTIDDINILSFKKMNDINKCKYMFEIYNKFQSNIQDIVMDDIYMQYFFDDYPFNLQDEFANQFHITDYQLLKGIINKYDKNNNFESIYHEYYNGGLDFDENYINALPIYDFHNILCRYYNV